MVASLDDRQRRVRAHSTLLADVRGPIEIALDYFFLSFPQRLALFGALIYVKTHETFDLSVLVIFFFLFRDRSTWVWLNDMNTPTQFYKVQSF